jgi:hypothetical protein
MKVLFAFTFASTLLYRASLVRAGEPGVLELPGQEVAGALKDVRLDLTAAMRDKLAGAGIRRTHEGADGGTKDHIRSLRRSLNVGDFEEFNQLFMNASIRLPDFEVSQKVLFNTFKLKITELTCRDLSVGDIVLTPNKESNQRLTFKVDLVDLTLNCEGRFNYDWGRIDGNGSVEANINKSQASTVLAFSSTNFALEPPGDSTVDSCDASINIDNMEFRGKIISKILDAAQNAVGNQIEGALEGGKSCVSDCFAFSVRIPPISHVASVFFSQWLVKNFHHWEALSWTICW